MTTIRVLVSHIIQGHGKNAVIVRLTDGSGGPPFEAESGDYLRKGFRLQTVKKSIKTLF